jgi:GGDEF domain-containing protein
MFNPETVVSLLLVAAIVGVLWTVGFALLRLARRRLDLAELPDLPEPAELSGPARGWPTGVPAAASPPHDARTPARSSAPVGQIGAAFLEWLLECDELEDTWTAFDQLVRETLTEHLLVTRVRCYHVPPGADVLQTISQASQAAAAGGPSLRDGILGHVATTGREFVWDDPAHGPLVHALATRSDDEWAWVWPVRQKGGTRGIVAVGHAHDPLALTVDVRQAVGALISLCWEHVTCLERLRSVQRTDQASGVLTRNDFFTLAGHALADSYQANEPVVVAVFALEGLRGLDDTGQWLERDQLVVQVGQAVSRRTRSDDLVGRFADDRFVVLLRRLDSGLGRIIAEKMLAAAGECLTHLDAVRERVRVRVGLAGTGFARPTLPQLLSAAMHAVEQARREHAPLQTDLGVERAEPGSCTCMPELTPPAGSSLDALEGHET